MALQHQMFISLDECITDYLNESEQSINKYYKVWHLAYRALTELGLDAFFFVKSVKLPVNANLTVTLPEDYLMYSKVGILNDRGEIITMGVNNKLTTAYDLQPTRIEQTQDPNAATYYTGLGIYWYNYWDGSSYGNLYGMPSGAPFIGSFKIDNANGVIVLSENFCYPYVMLEYTSCPKEGGEYYLPVQFKEAVISYLRWKDKISTPSKTHVDNASLGARRHEFFNDRRLAIARFDPVNLPDLYQWNLENQRLTVKA